ncbi:MAG: MerR family transcriptional regulator [Phycisphaerae bacterium]|nr:MerR family transcriptional regulator [Gemmatimonadaceae bacterium]
MNKRPKAPAEAAGGHTISVVADRTGLSRDVLRVWERRYQAVDPQRTPGGQRLYSDEELARFQLLAAATRHGRSIGSVAGLSTGDLARIVASDVAARMEATPRADSIPNVVALEVATVALEHARALDASSLDRELRRAIGRYGLPMFLEAIVPALMRRVGDEWAAGRLAIPHEHLASGIVLGILLEAVRAIPETPGAPRLLVATPAGEQHVVGAALIAAAAALDGWSILFLGANVPAADLAMAANGARAVALSIVHAHDAPHTVREIQSLRAALPSGIPVIAGGTAAVRLQSAGDLSGVTVCADIAEARVVLARVARGESLLVGVEDVR